MKKRISYEYSHAGIEASILRQAKGLRMPEGWAKQVAKRAADATDKWIKNKDIVTENDLRIFLSKELEKIAPDIAMVYHNHDKII